MQLRKSGMLALAIVAILAAASPARAQITTGNISGTVNDSQGGVIPGATVVLKSESRGTALAPVVTNEAGVYVFANITPDVYTIEVTMDSFKTVRRTNIRVSGGDRVGVPAMVLEAGGVAETVNVSAEALLVQSQSAERSFAVSSEQIEGLPINRQNFTSLLAFAPGVKINGSGSTGFERLGGVSQNNLMMDGISAMDTGNNGTMLAMNVESIGEIKILTQGYQAEYGRSSGLQVTAVTKSGTNRFRGSVYDVERDSTLELEQLGEPEQRRPEAYRRRKGLGLLAGRSHRQAGRQQQAVLLLQPRVPSTEPADQQRQPDPPARADAARARRRFLAEPRQQRRPASAVVEPDRPPAVSE